MRLPAYASELAAARQRGLVPAPAQVIVALDRWELGRPRGSIARCVVPPDVDIDDLGFAFVAGLDVIIAWDSRMSAGARTAQLARRILESEPRRLLCLNVSPDSASTCRWVKSVERGIEI